MEAKYFKVLARYFNHRPLLLLQRSLGFIGRFPAQVPYIKRHRLAALLHGADVFISGEALPYGVFPTSFKPGFRASIKASSS